MCFCFCRIFFVTLHIILAFALLFRLKTTNTCWDDLSLFIKHTLVRDYAVFLPLALCYRGSPAVNDHRQQQQPVGIISEWNSPCIQRIISIEGCFVVDIWQVRAQWRLEFWRIRALSGKPWPRQHYHPWPQHLGTSWGQRILVGWTAWSPSPFSE